MRTPWLVATATALSLSLTGCEQDETRPNFEFAPDMVSSEAYDSFAPNPNTRDGRTLMRPPEGSIARGATPFHFGPGFEEGRRAGLELKNPVEPTAENFARGQVVFDRMCAACHAATGLGDGLVTARFPAPPSLLAKNAENLADGHLFHIITTGQGLMPAHGAQVAPEDRWRVIHWVRRLQTTAKLAQKASR